MLNRVEEHIEFHKTIMDAIKEKGVFHKAYDRHKADVEFLNAVRNHMHDLYSKIGELEIKLDSAILDTK